jgi:AraC-like DNA-binding protein
MVDSTRGILRPGDVGVKFDLQRFSPSEPIAHFVEAYWFTSWDLRGQPRYAAEILSFPCVHVVFEEGRSGIFGVVRSKFTRVLEGRGRAFGVKFRPGGFYPFVRMPVSALTDGLYPLSEVFGDDLEDAVLKLPSGEAMVPVVEHLLFARLPVADEAIALIDTVVEFASTGRGVTRVEDFVARFGIGKRSLQRLFRQYVGVTPKWVIKRFRLQEAAERLAAGDDIVQVAVELGYFDQAHFSRDFKGIVGSSPTQYARSAHAATK